MRQAVASVLSLIADEDPRVLLLTGDLGYMALEPFAERHPGRFFNVGVAEQNMVALATGLAEAGYIPFTYSIATFASLRPYEFVRNGPARHRLPVRIVGVGGGFEYGSAGSTHHALEDIAVMRAQPGITVVVPADHEQARTAVHETYDRPGPVYYRLSKDDRTVVPGLHGRFALGSAEILHRGRDVVIVATGAIASEAAKAISLLEAQGCDPSFAIVSSFNPEPRAQLKELLSTHRVALAVEAHYATGGLGSLLSEIAAEDGLGCRVIRCGVSSAPDGRSGSQKYLQELHRLDAGSLARTALSALRPVRVVG